MGTNYYLHKPDTNHCACCGRSDKGNVIHIGKSSGGWTFALHVYPEQGIDDLQSWEKLFATGEIRDEYARAITQAEMLEIITNRSHPSGLLRRSRYDGSRCIGHGAGTWDLIVGDFS